MSAGAYLQKRWARWKSGRERSWEGAKQNKTIRRRETQLTTRRDHRFKCIQLGVKFSESGIFIEISKPTRGRSELTPQGCHQVPCWTSEQSRVCTYLVSISLFSALGLQMLFSTCTMCACVCLYAHGCAGPDTYRRKVVLRSWRDTEEKGIPLAWHTHTVMCDIYPCHCQTCACVCSFQTSCPHLTLSRIAVF